MVNYGETVIIAAVKSEVAEPEVDALDKGFLGTLLCRFLFHLFSIV